MFGLSIVNLDPIPAACLADWQTKIDELPDYAARVNQAKRQFPLRNKSANVVFQHIKSKLDLMCCGARRCAYCEDSAADEVEHIKPKDLYPEAVFNWDNYVYACGPCNGPKKIGSLYLWNQPECAGMSPGVGMLK